MKRALALLITLLMVLSLFPMTALAEGESTDTPAPVAAEETATAEPTAAPEETPVPEDTATPEPSITPEATATEALASESPSVEALFLRLLDCDSLDADGTGHTDVLCLAGDALGLKVSAETNGALSYRWQTLDQDSTADDPYVDIDTSDEPTADEEELSILADAAVLGVADYYRCVVTATLGEETVVSESYFTLQSSDATETPDLSLALDLVTEASSYPAVDFAGLKSALSSSTYTTVYCSGNINVTEDLVIPSTKTLVIMNNSYTLTIDADVTVTNNGRIEVGSMGYLSVGGTLKNAGAVIVYSGGSMEVTASGTYQESGSNASLALEQTDASTIALINGVDSDLIYYSGFANDESGLANVLSNAGGGYLGADVYLESAVTMSYDLTVPSGATLWLDDDLTVDSGVTLTIDGSLQIPEGITLTNHGTIVNNGYISAEGSLDSDSPIEGSGYYYNPATATSEAQVRGAIAAGKSYITVGSAFALTADLTIPSGVTLDITGVQLTIPTGKTLLVEGSVDIYSATASIGRLLVKSGATLENNGKISAVSGTLLVETGATYSGLTDSLFLYSKYGTNVSSGTITGIDKSEIVVVGIAYNDGEIRNAIAFGGKGYQKIEIDLMQSVSLASNLVLPAETYMIIGAGSGAVTLTVPSGKILTNYGEIYVNPGSTLKINTNATLVNNGTVEAYGSYVNDGTLSGTGTLTTGDETVTDLEEFVAAINAHRATILISGDVVLDADLVIPRGTTVILNDSTASLTVPSGVSLTVNGTFVLSSGLFEILDLGELVNNDLISISGGSFTVNSGATFTNNASVELWGDGSVSIDASSYVVGEADASIYYNDAEGATLSGISLEYVYCVADVEDVAGFSDALAKAADGYKSVQVNVNTDLTLSSDDTIPANVAISVGSGATLTIDTGATVSLFGSMFIDSDSTLQINSDATLAIEEDGALQVNGTLLNNGTITNSGNFGTNVNSYAELLTALANGVTSIDITSNFSLMGDLVVTENMMLTVYNATLTVPAGRTLTVEGNLILSNGTVTVASSGKLLNKGQIDVIDQSTLSINTGATYTQTSGAYLSFLYGVGTISGVSKDKISCTVEARTETALRSGLALAGYRELWVNLYSTAVLSADLTVPANVYLNILADPGSSDATTLAVPSGRTLTCAGFISLMDGAVLDIRTGGTLLMTATGSLGFSGGTMKADGTVTYSTGSEVYRSVYTESQLIDAVNAKTTRIIIAGNITLSESLTFPNGVGFSIVDDGSLTVPAGIELSIGENECWIAGGTLTVESGATLVLPDPSSLTINGGDFVIDGTVSFGGYDAKIFYYDNGETSMSGASVYDLNDHMYATAWASNLEELESVLSNYADSPYASNEIYLTDSITLEGDLTVPGPEILMVTDGNTLTVPEGYTLTIESGATLNVQDGGKLVVNGTLNCNGMANFSLSDVSGTGEINNLGGSLSYHAKATSLTQLKAAIATGKTPLDIECSGFAITTNLTIPADVHVWFNASSTASIASGVIVTNNGVLSLYGKFTISGTLINNYYLRVEEGATLTNNGTLKNFGDADIYGTMVNNGTVTVNSGCRVRFSSGATLSGTKTTGTWYSLNGETATGLEIVGPKYVGIGVDLTQSYLVEMVPSNAWPMDVHWSIVDGDTLATIDEETGDLTGISEGDVVICATSVDDGDIFAQMTVHIVDYSVTINGAESMLAGKTLQLTGSFIPSGSTDSKILWSLGSGDTDYASISQSGLVTAKAVTEKHTIAVIASDADGVADSAEQEITIYPAITDIQILTDEDEDVTGDTLVLNSNDETAELNLIGVVIPTDGMTNITWTLSSTNAATMEVTGDRSVTITPVSGETQLITLTAKANDGSGKSASVKIQVAALSNGLIISDDLGAKLNAGGKTQLNVAFYDPQPSNEKVTWYLAPEYEAYATLSTTGLLTAKAVTKAVTVQVVAIPADGGTESDPYAVTILPVPTAVSLLQDGVFVTNSTLTLDLRGTATLELDAKSWPDDADDSVIWKSSASTIVSVDETGKITGLKAGTATISATTAIGAKSASVKVTVTSLAQNIELYETDTVKPVYELRGGSGTSYRVIDSDTDQLLLASAVRWEMDSDFAPYATLSSSGTLTTYPVSTAKTITLRAEVIGNESAYVEFDVVIDPAAQSISLYNGSALQTKPITINSYEKTAADVTTDSVTLTAPISPDDSLQTVTWTSSNMNVAQVVDGVIKPVWNGSGYNKGTTIITAKATDGSNVAASVQVVVAELVHEIELTTTSGKFEMTSGGSLQMKATVKETSATNKAVVYSIVDGAEYATLSGSGLLTAKQVYGDRTVTVQAVSADGGATDDQEITIHSKYDEPLTITNVDTGETISGETVSLSVAGTSAKTTLFNLSVPEAISTTKVKWSVAPSYVASVVISGEDTLLRYLATGTAVVTATATEKDGTVRTASFTLELYKPATSLTITPPKGVEEEGLTLASGKTMLFTGVIAPTTGVTTKGVNWSIDEGDADYATISSSGLLTAKAGLTEPVTIQVYAVTKNQPYLEDTIEVALTPLSTGVDILSDEKVINNQTLTIDLTTPTLDLDPAVYPADKANQNVVWSSSNKTIAKVDSDGIVTGLKAGTVTITAKAADGSGKSASIKVVVKTLVTGLEITSKTGFDMCGGKTLQLGITFTPTTPTDKRVTWSLSTADAQYATITSSGLLKANALTSKVSITVVATSVDNPDLTPATQVVNIYPATTKVEILNSESETINDKTLVFDLNTPSAKTLTAQNQPNASTGALQSVTWKSSNTAVLTVSSEGVIEPVLNASTGLYRTGTVTITATATDGSKKSASVKVVVGYLVSGITFDSGLTVAAGKTLTIKPTFDPVNVTNKKLVWTIEASDAPYATISSTGVLTAKKVTEEKFVTVYCTAQDGSGIVGEAMITITP